MNYLEFLARWYNLSFVFLVLAGLGIGLKNRLGGRGVSAVSISLVAAGIIGLTVNGALHDLALDGYERRFPLVLSGALLIGSLLGAATARARRRLSSGVRGLSFTVPGLEGSRAKIVSREVASEPASGRAQWRDEDGVMHVVRVHTKEGSLPFGRDVRLVTYDESGRSYLVEVD